MNSQIQAGPTVGSKTLSALGRYPDRVAFAWDGGWLTYGQAKELIGRFQLVYATYGLRRGQRLALLSGNRAEAWCASVAAHASGLATTWLHSIGSLEDQLYQLDDAEVDGLIVDAQHHRERGEELAAKVAKRIVILGIGPSGFGTDLLAAAETVGTATPRDVAFPDDIVTLSYTGGTTGRAKGVLRRHPALTAGRASILANFELPNNPRYLAVAPISHAAGSKILPTLSKGGSVHLVNGFSADRVLDAITRERINFVLMVPTMIYALLDEPKLAQADLSSLELLLYGASPMAPSRLLEGIERIGPVFSQFYGQTECYPIAVLRKSDHDPSRPGLFGACGAPVTDCEVKLLDESGTEVPQGEAGEICVRSPSAFEAYWKLPALTAETLKQGWLHTGDVARADERGYLYIIDRRKEMIVTGGVNVYPREVEDALTSHDAVSMAAVFGVPDPHWGEAVMAVVVLRTGAKSDAQTLIQHVKMKKGSVQAPKRIDFAESLPMTAIGKIDKQTLRAVFWVDRERLVG
jgi:fatty-acyl-CoA synthase